MRLEVPTSENIMSASPSAPTETCSRPSRPSSLIVAVRIVSGLSPAVDEASLPSPVDELLCECVCVCVCVCV
jgi:hypothetical protein